jgi:2-methylcitrate dehydratase
MAGIAERLSSYAVSLKYRDLPSSVVHEVKRRAIDSLGCALGAYSSPPARIVRTVASRVPVEGGSILLGTSFRTTPDLAAFVNGTMVRYLDYNDTYLSREPAHPSDNLPALLAVGEMEGVSGKEVLLAAALAYEVQCRLCDAASLRERGWDHVTYGPFSTALAVSKLMGLSEEQISEALSLAGVANNALRQTRVGEISLWKASAFANASRNGVFAALLAREGMTGPSEIFEGEMGFWRQVSGPFDLPSLGGERGVPFRILDSSLKFYPAEYHAQSGIEAALRLRSRLPDPAGIEAIRVRTFDVAVEIIGRGEEKWDPRTRETADHSLPYLVAAALLDGTIGEEQFTPERIRDPRLLETVQKVEVVESPEMSRRYPEAVPTEVEVVLERGETLREEVTYPRGHPRNPMSDTEVEEKFRSLTRGWLSPEKQEEALGLLWELEKVGDWSSLFPLLTVEAAP